MHFVPKISFEKLKERSLRALACSHCSAFAVPLQTERREETRVTHARHW
jgi:hypothetical protein